MFYVKGTKHLAADGLSRRPPQPGHGDEEGDVDYIIKMDLDYLGITPLITRCGGQESSTCQLS